MRLNLIDKREGKHSASEVGTVKYLHLANKNLHELWSSFRNNNLERNETKRKLAQIKFLSS